jgi:hypothetical protein
VRRLGIEAKCTAIDTWAGDEHAGFYGGDVFDRVREEARHYPFAVLMQSTFDAAKSSFPEGSIDLLHIDGRHFYEDVRHDWDTWRPMLSERGVALFHDTRVYKKGFGVYQLWAEINGKYPSFEFHHGNGLGVLGVGAHFTPPVQALLSANANEATAIRRAYYRLGLTLNSASPSRVRRRGAWNRLIGLARGRSASIKRDTRAAPKA